MWPSAIQSALQGICRNANTLGPVLDVHGDSINSQHGRINPIAVLFGVSGPSAIAGFVVAFVVWVAINAVLFAWPRSHVREERLKGVFPSVAHRNSTTAIPFEHFAASIEASVFHFLPDFILRPVRHSVRRIAGSSTKAHAAAGLAVSATQITTLNYRGRSTFTAAQPIASLADVAVNFQDGEFSEQFSDQIKEWSFHDAALYRAEV